METRALPLLVLLERHSGQEFYRLKETRNGGRERWASVTYGRRVEWARSLGESDAEETHPREVGTKSRQRT